MTFDDYYDGTACIFLHQSDFKSKERFRQYARFMKQDENSIRIKVPIDSDRARKEMKKR
jgi:hypothetical protein